MHALTKADLFSLENYAAARAEFRTRVMAHKRNRRVDLGDHLSLFFEDRLTMQYQIQEMLRAERIFEPSGIQDELDAYNPLIPDGNNWKATLMVQYEDVEERRKALAQLIGIEDSVWVQIGEHPKVWPVADEDLGRETEEKTSAVHFLRFELTRGMVAAAKAGNPIALGVEHPAYHHQVSPLPESIATSLVEDLN
jgi:hypothetical protein